MLPPQPLPGCTKRLTVAAVILYTAARIVANVVMVETIGHSIWTEMQLRGGFCCSSHFLCVFLVFFVFSLTVYMCIIFPYFVLIFVYCHLCCKEMN